MILTKLEEMIRNKQLLSYSSRFYDEIKTFVWKGNKAQAMKGYNDDLVMSLAIGSWICDTTSGVSQDSRALTDAMLKSMRVDRKTYDDFPGGLTSKKSQTGNAISRNQSSTTKKKPSRKSWKSSGGDFDWLID